MELQDLIQSIFDSDKNLEQKIKARLNEIQKEMLYFLNRKGVEIYPVPYDQYGFQEVQANVCKPKIQIEIKKINNGSQMIFKVNNGAYDGFEVYYDEVIVDESQINQKFDEWVIRQTIILLQRTFGKW